MRDDDLADRIVADYTTAGLSERRFAMLSYAEKLTRDPGAIEKADVESLRAVGFEDIDILHIVEVTSYFAYANRIADGLGIPLEDWIDEN